MINRNTGIFEFFLNHLSDSPDLVLGPESLNAVMHDYGESVGGIMGFNDADWAWLSEYGVTLQQAAEACGDADYLSVKGYPRFVKEAFDAVGAEKFNQDCARKTASDYFRWLRQLPQIQILLGEVALQDVPIYGRRKVYL